MRFLFLEPFFGGSHRYFAEGLQRFSRHEIDLIHLPARFWKWRMRGAALYFIRQISNLKAYDGLIASSMMSLSDFKALAGSNCPPVLTYFHENQLSYPLAPGESMDLQYGFTDITTALNADRILFNSKTHYQTFFAMLPDLIRKMPEFRPLWVVDKIRARSGVLHPGCKFSTEAPGPALFDGNRPPLIVWNHRWEFDKDPDAFFYALSRIADDGLDFRLALLGEQFSRQPASFAEARRRYSKQIVQYGHVPSRKIYHQWLSKGDIVVSTALQENFGISVVEAIRSGCLPLLPDRLSYPEIIPGKFHADVLYRNATDLIDRLRYRIAHLSEFAGMRKELAMAMDRFSWPNTIDQYDEALDDLAYIRRDQTTPNIP